MPTNKKQIRMNRYRERALDQNDVPARRLRAAKSLVELAGYSQRTCPVARRVANELLNPEMPEDIRGTAVKLLENVAVGEAQRLSAIRQEPVVPVESVDDEVERVVNDEPAPIPVGVKIKMQETVEKPAPAAVPTETREQELIRKNRHWNAEPVPQKWLYFHKHSDLEHYGIPDVVRDPRRLFVDSNDLILGPNRMCNPLYIDVYRAWKAKRFPHGLPERDSVWRVRYENRQYVNACPGLLAKWPAEFPVGEDLRRREYQRGDVAVWEEPFCHELYFEILFAHRGQEFFVMFEIEGPDEAYFAAREHERTAPPKPTVIEQRPLPETKMVCRVCHNATQYTPALIHDCSHYMEPEIFARIGAQHRAL